MLIVALVLAVVGLAALVTAVVTSNELIAWVCIGASVIGVVLLIVDALQERSRNAGDADATVEPHGDDTHDDATTVMPAVSDSEVTEDYPEEPAGAPSAEAHDHTEAHDETETTGIETHDEARSPQDKHD